jgi:hypothetical protein
MSSFADKISSTKSVGDLDSQVVGQVGLAKRGWPAGGGQMRITRWGWPDGDHRVGVASAVLAKGITMEKPVKRRVRCNFFCDLPIPDLTLAVNVLFYNSSL